METAGKKLAENALLSMGSLDRLTSRQLKAISPPFARSSLFLRRLSSSFHLSSFAITLYMPNERDEARWGSAKSEARAYTRVIPPSVSLFLSLCLFSFLFLSGSPFLSFNLSRELSIQRPFAGSIFASIFQKKSKRRLGNLGERPSPFDGRDYVDSVQTTYIRDRICVYTPILDYIAKNDRRIFRLSSLGVSMSRSSEADLSRLIRVASQQRARYI